MRNETIIIPALDPNAKMLSLIEELHAVGFYRIIVVDDGSAYTASEIFARAEELGCFVIHHDKNMGKGEAIKSAIRMHRQISGDAYGVITVDADGQHIPNDVVKISNAMAFYENELILGTRDFDNKNVPWKSRYGNRITSFFFKLKTGIRCDDTQTGLRGIPASLLSLAENEEGSRYEYEMLFLEDAVKQASVRYIPIATVYEDNNSCSHFRPIRDSARIYARPLKFAASSLAGAAVDLIMFYILLNTLGLPAAILTGAATIIARLISGGVNFTLNKYWCFRSRKSIGGEAAGYMLLFISQMITSALLVTWASKLTPPLAAKILVDTTLFIISYHIQRRYIFRKDVKIMKKKRPVWAVSFGLILTGYAVFTLLDAFVIPHDMVKLSDVSTTTSNTSSTTGNDDSSGENTGGFLIADDSANSDDSTNHKSPDNFTDSGKHGRDFDTEHTPGTKSDKTYKHMKKRPSDASDVNAAGRHSNHESSETNSTGTKNTYASSNDVSTYESDNMTITVTKKYVNNTYVYIADIQLKDSSLLQSAVADNTLGRNITAKTSEIAEEAGAILAINGDFYGFRDTGYVMRNGYLYRETSSGDDSEDLVVYSDGTMEIIKEGDITAKELQEKGAVQIYSFGPGLVENGKISVNESTEVDQSMRSNPRTAIGYYSSTHYCFVVSDGRTTESEGLSLYQLAEVMEELGVTSAYNLDGGGSTTMYFNGEVINNPTTNGNKISERSVSDIVYIKKD